MKEELLDCPFCGGPSEYFEGNINCIKCKATMGDRSKKELYAMWNTRTNGVANNQFDLTQGKPSQVN